MDRTEILAGVKRALGEVLKEPVTDVTEETSLLGELCLNSATILELLMALEDVFDVEVSTDSLRVEAFKTIGTLAGYVDGIVNLGGGPAARS
jgi:acyl carrier protein